MFYFDLCSTCKLSCSIILLFTVDFLVTVHCFFVLDSISIAVIFIENRLPVGHEVQTSNIPTGVVMTFFSLHLFGCHLTEITQFLKLIDSMFACEFFCCYFVHFKISL